MKKKALAAAIFAATTMTASSALAATNPFNDVPSDHWAYDAIAMLAEDGVLEGYGDGTFNGTRAMNRYEMAEIVSKVVDKYDLVRPADKGAIKKLEKEFASELKDMDVRLTNVENDVKEIKNGMSSFKWFGDARIRYFKNKSGTAINKANIGETSDYNQYRTDRQNEMRVRLGFYGEPAENLSVKGQLKAENANIARRDFNSSHYAGKGDEKMSFNRLQLDWHAKNGVTVSAGRNELSLGQGLTYWENPMDGVMVKKDFGDKASILVGVGDSSAATWDSSAGYANFVDVRAHISPAVELTAAYYNQSSDATNSYSTYAEWSNNGNYYWSDGANKWTTKRDFRQFAVGINAKLAPKWSLIAEGVHNSADVKSTISDATITNTAVKPNDGKNGLWSRLIYGQQIWNKANTWQVYGEYFALGGKAIDSSGWAHRLNIAGGNGYGGQGARGWGIGAGYMVADNTNLELTYYKLKPYDSGSAGFNSYKDVAYAALTYSF